MKKSAFTMIELIFVIVILGILAAVALPRLGGLQNDALITAEQSGVSAIRTGITAINGRRLTRGSTAMTLNLVDSEGATHGVTLQANATPAIAQNAFSTAGFPWHLSVAGTIGTAATPENTIQAAGNGAGGVPLLLIAQIDNPGQWATATGTNADNTVITGPASSTVADDGSGLTITNADQWAYLPATGTVVFDSNSSSY